MRRFSRRRTPAPRTPCQRHGAIRLHRGGWKRTRRRRGFPLPSLPRFRRGQSHVAWRFLLPPPLWGRVGVGGREVATRQCPIRRPPPPAPPHKGEGSKG